ncbi:MAG: hypothetical protein KAG97_10565, partial [Victivallales bacterium]|nr:hypothetical protein [Victivallales bacterium]
RDSLFPDCRFTDYEGTFLAPGDPECDPLVADNLPTYSRLFFRGVKPRQPDEPLMQVHCEIARAVQKSTSETVIEIAKRLHAATGCDNICVAGGFALNCSTNAAYVRKTPFKRVYIQPAATDAGIPLGAAMHGYHSIAGQPFRPGVFSPFMGRAYSNKRILDALRDYPDLKYSRPRNLAARAAALIADGKICGWFKGGSEFGPRALGARSILADPRNMDVRERLNTTVKLREDFRPYAPAVLEERCAELFRFKSVDPHMLFLADARPMARKLMPAVIHVDGTARLQTVSKKDNKRLRKLIEEFDSLTGIPALLNTSFNRRGEPIVESPDYALDCFTNTGIDFLILEDYIVRK